MKLLISLLVLYFVVTLLSELLLYRRFKKDKSVGNFLGDYRKYKNDKLIRLHPAEKPRLNSFYERPFIDEAVRMIIGLGLIFLIMNLS